MDVIDINQLRQKALEEAKGDFADSQQRVITQLCKTIENLKEKNTHLEGVLNSLAKNNIIEDVSSEELICIEQINIIKTRSSQRELSTDEVKKLDLLIKNLKLLRQESTVIMSSSSYKSLPPEDLLAIAEAGE